MYSKDMLCPIMDSHGF